jgi:lipopolysaccharide/colanic/teichoic acid biosynthesis glycosyltransferase
LILLLSVIFTISVIAKFHASLIGDYDLTESRRFIWINAYSLLCFAVAYSFGLPDQRTWSARSKAAAASAITSAVFIAAIQVVLGQISLPRFVIAASIPGLFIILIIVSLVNSKIDQTVAGNERVLLIASQEDADIIQKDIDYHTETPCVITRHITVAEALSGEKISTIISENQITLVVLDNEAVKNDKIIQAITSVHSQGVRVRTQLAFYNDWLGKVPVRELGETALLFDVREIHHVGYSRISRMLDVCIASVGFIALIIATPIVCIGNYFGNKGPLLYAQERVGKGQTSFRILKFRSMIPGSSVGEWTKKNDARITAFGKFLRLSHLDELPQVLNILRGDLSIVGPRPEQSHYVQQLSQTIPYYQSRHLVRPGLTGWAQVNYPYGADEIDAFEKLQYEFWYLRHQSMWLDLRIIARTFRHVLGFKGR